MTDDDRPRKTAPGHAVGQDLSRLSIEELDERIGHLSDEIERLRSDKAKKAEMHAAAADVFKSRSDNN